MSNILRWSVVRTRKDHQCSLCDRVIPKGNHMVSAAWADAGTVWGSQFCLVCDQYWRHVLHSEEISFDDPIYGDDKETWDKIRREMEQERVEG
jgi:hypothetical protein